MTPERRSLRWTQLVPTEAKLRPSVRPAGLVMRGALVDRLYDTQSSGVVVVTAPPGYGKTVLVSQWVEEDPRPSAWVTLDEGDNDPRVLVAYIVLALHRLQPVEPAVLSALSDDRPEAFADVLLPRLALMAANRRPTLLVLDAVEALTDPRSLEVLQVLGSSLGEHSQLVLVGRAAPSDWPSLAAAGRLRTIGIDDLRLDRAEVLALVQGMGLRLSSAEVDALLTSTEGWAAGIYLAALSIAGDVDRRSLGDLVTGSDSLIAAYLGEEVLDGLTPEVQAFLRRTSVLRRLSGSLCDAVLATTGSAEVLHELAEANVLVSPQGGDDTEWYQVHPLLAEALQAALLRDEPRLVPALHSRASAWYEEHDVEHAADEAVEHAIAAQEYASAARLVWGQVGACLADGEVAKLEDWLARFPPRQTAAYAKLALTEAWCSLQRGRAGDHWISLAEHGRYEADRKGESTSVAAATALLRSLVSRNGVSQMGADARLALDLNDLDTSARCTAEFLIALSSYLSGRSEEGRSALERVLHVSQQTGSHQTTALALSELVLLAVDDEEWDAARDLSEQAMSVLQRHHLAEIPLLAPAHCAAALVSCHFDGPGIAGPAVQQAYRLFAAAVEPPLWMGVQCREVLARAQLSIGDTSAARTLLSEAQSLVTQTALDDAGDDPLRDRLEQSWRRVAGRPLDLSPGSTLTRAELRVLRLLPTHLSFAQIGQQLFVSRNTVKTQAVSAYRKLGVGSRSDAVDRARSLGLLQPPGP